MIFLLFFLPLAHSQDLLLTNFGDNASVFSVYWTRGRLNVKQGPCQGSQCVGEAIYENQVNKTGWALLQLETRDSFSDVIQVLNYSNEAIAVCDLKCVNRLGLLGF